MADNKTFLSRRELLQAIPATLAGTLLLQASPADANIFGIVFRIVGFGFGTVLVGGAIGLLAVGTVLAAVGQSLYSAYHGSANRSYGGGFYTSHTPQGWKPYVPAKPIVTNISLDSSGRMKGDVLRIRAIQYDLLVNDDIALPYGGRLVIEEDGTMRFADTQFRGYAHMQNNGDMTVFTPDHQLVLARKLDKASFCNLHHDSNDGRVALASLLGEIRHA